MASDRIQGAAGEGAADAAERPFWRSSGYALLERCGDGRLVLTDDFLCAYLGRPELQPVAEEACPAELALHAMLAATPRAPVDEDRLAALADAEARDNYRIFLRFRDLLLAHETLQGSYLSLFHDGATGIAPLFVDQLAHVILRSILTGCRDPFRLRAAELLFRTQLVTIVDGSILVADEETIEMRAARAQQTRELLRPAGGAAAEIELDLLNEAGAAAYWERSDRFDMALDIGFARPGLDALCRVLEAWIKHFLGCAVSIQPVQQIRDERWVWHVGLDAEASALLNALYRGETPPEEQIARLLSLFRLEFADPADMREDVAGRPVYLAMAMDSRNRLRLKPQNLLVALPLRNPA